MTAELSGSCDRSCVAEAGGWVMALSRPFNKVENGPWLELTAPCGTASGPPLAADTVASIGSIPTSGLAVCLPTCCGVYATFMLRKKLVRLELDVIPPVVVPVPAAEPVLLVKFNDDAMVTRTSAWQ